MQHLKASFNGKQAKLATLLTCTEHFAAAIATRGELRVVAVAAVDLVGLGAKLLVHQIQIAFEAQETGLVPVLVFVGKILREK